MPLNNANDAIVMQRRELVAELLLRKLTQREIVQALAQRGFYNPETGQAYTIGTINTDIKWLKREWRKQATETMEEHTAQIFAELQQVKRVAWAKGELAHVLKAINAERDMLGLIGTRKVDATLTGDLSIALTWGELGDTESNPPGAAS